MIQEMWGNVGQLMKHIKMNCYSKTESILLFQIVVGGGGGHLEVFSIFITRPLASHYPHSPAPTLLPPLPCPHSPAHFLPT